MESANAWPPSEELFSMAPTDDITNDLFNPSPTDSFQTWDPNNNNWKTEDDWRLFGNDMPTIDPLPQAPTTGLPSRTAPSSSLSSNNSSTALAPINGSLFPSAASAVLGTMLPFRPSEPTDTPCWAVSRPQPLQQHPFPRSASTGLLIEVPTPYQPQVMHNGGFGLGIFDKQTQNGPGITWNDGADTFNSQYSLHQTPQLSVPKLECTSPTDADDEAGDAGDQSYAKLLYECLFNAPGHTLPLKDIYTWMQQSTSKARDPNSKGWQNSVRHNLSMNQGFEKVQSSAGHGSKKGGAGLWRLSEDALRKGAIISTTRYRKEPKKRHGRRHGALPAPKRVASGAKGGRATRDGRDRQQRLQTRSYNSTLAHGWHQPRSTPYHGGMPTPGQYSSTSAASSPMFEHATMSGPVFGGFFPSDHAGQGMPIMNAPPNTSSPMPDFAMPFQPPRPILEQTEYIPTPPPSSEYPTDCESSPWITSSSVEPDAAELSFFNGGIGGSFQSPVPGYERTMHA